MTSSLPFFFIVTGLALSQAWELLWFFFCVVLYALRLGFHVTVDLFTRRAADYQVSVPELTNGPAVTTG